MGEFGDIKRRRRKTPWLPVVWALATALGYVLFDMSANVPVGSEPGATGRLPVVHRPIGTSGKTSGECLIKGNISENGRIYHVPGSRWYSETGINPSRGERWFCSEAEARAAGWRAPRY